MIGLNFFYFTDKYWIFTSSVWIYPIDYTCMCSLKSQLNLDKELKNDCIF